MVFFDTFFLVSTRVLAIARGVVPLCLSHKHCKDTCKANPPEGVTDSVAMHTSSGVGREAAVDSLRKEDTLGSHFF